MSLKLTWDDLLIRGFSTQQAAPWLHEWDWLVTGNVAPVFMSKFGNWFLRRPEGHVELLDVLQGTLTEIAPSLDDLYAQANERSWQEEQLLSLLIYHLHEEEKIPGPRECYGFAPHPRLTGTIEQEHITILTIHAWQRICSEFYRH